MEDTQLVCNPFFEKIKHIKTILEGSPTTGHPALYYGEYKNKAVLIKHWPTSKSEDTSTLKDIWLYEARQLQRLKGCPGVGDFITPIFESTHDDQGFYLILDSDGRLPLSAYEKTTKLSLKKPWINDLSNIKNRIKLWRNIYRLVEALQLLHSQGLLHRHLACDSILTDLSSEEPDFQLTGFEWSIRIQKLNEDSSNDSAQLSIEDGKPYSFLSDWSDFGRLLSDLLEINEIHNNSISLDQFLKGKNLTLDEVNIVRGLIGDIRLDISTPHEGLNADLVASKIDNIINRLQNFESQEPSSLGIAFLLQNKNRSNPNRNYKLPVFTAIQMAINEKHGITISEERPDEFFAFIQDDLNETKLLACIPSSNGLDSEILLLGKKLTYVLNKSKRDHFDTDTTWDYAFCHSAYIELPRKIDNTIQTSKVTNRITLMTHFDKDTPKREKLKSWSDLVNHISQDNKGKLQHFGLAAGFGAYHLAEIAFAKSEIYPVEIASYVSDPEDQTRKIVQLKSRYDNSSEDISASLSIKSPAARLKEIFKDPKNEYSSWSLVSNQNFSEDEQDTVLDFVQNSSEQGEDIYEFTTNDPEPRYQNYYIIPTSIQGTVSQLERRSSAIDALSEHSELSLMLEAPHRCLMSTNYEFSGLHQSFEALDESKKEVFKKILSTLPLYLVQGPPGVGKTYLITALMQQLFTDEPNSRVLLTAQSHSTIQHLYKEVMKVIEPLPTRRPPLTVACIKENEDDDPTDKLDQKAREYLQRIIDSDIFKKSKSEASKNKIIESVQPNRRHLRYPFMGQILRSANLVFSTTNSRQVEELIKARSQFDWTIMEETGKVSGVELLSPLLLSYRRLMIGDHRQLPPYASERMKKTLQDIGKLRKALIIAAESPQASLKGEFIKKHFTSEQILSLSNQELELISTESLRLHLLFESLIQEEINAEQRHLEFYKNKENHKTIASMLEIQHRMHPNIASIISDVFYDKNLKTSQEKISYYCDTSPPFYFKETNESFASINATAITWINTPDSQTNRSTSAKEEKPQWHNTLERDITLNLLKNIERAPSAEKAPKLAVLSPYATQVRKLSNEIQRAPLKNLRNFSKPDDINSFCSTVDAFQGAEADIVVISMVRNNHFSYAMSALGFLLDSRRMNVLLSRAKHKLIIIGSYEFLEAWSKKIQSEEIKKGNIKNKFLVDLCTKLNTYKNDGTLNYIEHTDI